MLIPPVHNLYRVQSVLLFALYFVEPGYIGHCTSTRLDQILKQGGLIIFIIYFVIIVLQNI